jgi:hypothetical protein
MAPADELELVFLLAGCESRRRELRPRTRELLRRVDYTRLERELAERRVLPLIGTRALDAGGDLARAGFRDTVERALAAARAHGLAAEWGTRHAVESLADSGIRALPLKGPLLAAEAHGDVGLRETADVDLLVEPGALDAAARALVQLGYAPPADVRRGDGLPDLHLGLVHSRLPRVELHWRVHWYERSFAADMLAAAAPGPDGLLRARREDLAASLLLFYARDGFHGVRAAADIGAWWDRFGGELPPAFLEGHLRRYPELAPALTAAAHVAEQVAGVPAVGWLGERAASGHRVALAIRLADWTQRGDRDQLMANISLVGGLLGPRGSGREFFRRELIPHEAGPGGRALHGTKTLARYGLALWRVRGRRSWSTPPPAATS